MLALPPPCSLAERIVAQHARPETNWNMGLLAACSLAHKARRLKRVEPDAVSGTRRQKRPVIVASLPRLRRFQSFPSVPSDRLAKPKEITRTRLMPCDDYHPLYRGARTYKSSAMKLWMLGGIYRKFIFIQILLN
jgi:hypothetical protein